MRISSEEMRRIDAMIARNEAKAMGQTRKEFEKYRENARLLDDCKKLGFPNLWASGRLEK